jgi:hypothetical protein
VSQPIPLRAHAKGCTSEEENSSSSEDDEFSKVFQHAGDFTAALSGGQFYPQLGEHFLFKPCAGVDPFFISWALNGHRTRIEGGAKHQHYKCAGCLICSESCGFTARPRTRSTKEQYCGNVRKHGGRNVVLTLQTCQVEFHYKIDLTSRDVDLQVTGPANHQHAKPPPKGPGPVAVAAITAAIQAGGKRPSATAMLINSQNLQTDAGAQDVIRLQRRITELYKEHYGDDLGIHGLSKQNFGEPFVRDIRIPYGDPSCADTNFEFVFLQLESQIQLARDLGSSLGMLTSKYMYADVTYSFGCTYRLTIMTDSLESGKGITLAVILMTRLHTSAYARAFYTFLKTNPQLWRVEDFKLELLFSCVVVDFSDSQKNGFVMAVKQLWQEHCRAEFTEEDSRRFLANLKGCYFHFMQSVRNVKNNGNIVPASKVSEFEALTNEMYRATTMQVFESTVNEIRQKFPKSKTWINWWTQPGHRILIFAACRSSELEEELRNFYNMPTTNNVVESNNRNVNRFLSYKDMPIVVAAFDVFRFCKHETRQLDGIRSGLIVPQAREASRRSIVSTLSDEYTDGRRVPTTTKELMSTAARPPIHPDKASAFTAPASTQKSKTTKRGRTPEDVEALRNNIRSNGLPPNSIVQVLNLQDNDKW